MMPENKIYDEKSLLDELSKLNISLAEFKKLEQIGISLDDLKRLHETILWKTIQKKLIERHNQKYGPHPEDKITNPLAIKTDCGIKPAYTDVAGKRALYNQGLDNRDVAYTGFKEYIRLGDEGAEFNDVEFIAGIWRVQKKFSYEITDVRDRQFVLVKKLPHVEKTKFEFYSAASAVWSGSGCSADVLHPDWIVAKYETPRGTYWSYGRTIEQARAFLGIKLYDEYQDLIHATAFKQNNQK